MGEIKDPFLLIELGSFGSKRAIPDQFDAIQGIPQDFISKVWDRK